MALKKMGRSERGKKMEYIIIERMIDGWKDGDKERQGGVGRKSERVIDEQKECVCGVSRAERE